MLKRDYALRNRVDDPRIRRARRTVVAIAFGDRTGVTLFCAVLAFYVLTWRVGMFITDIGLFVSLLDRVAAGHLSLGRVGTLDTIYPGMYHVGADVYGRNYGQIVASLPAYYFVEALGPVLFRWVVVIGWSGLVGAVVTRVLAHRGRGRRLAIVAGAAVAIVALAPNAVTFKPFRSGSAILALQMTAMLAATGTAVVLYRLVARRSGTRLGVLAGGAVAVATPVGFWATVPKRHAFSALLVVVALYALTRSRDPASELATARLGQAGFRGVAYASAGLLAWIHAPVGFTLFLALAVVDLPTAPTNDARTLAIVGGAFAISLVPFFLTNFLISADPVQPPRFLPGYRGPDSVPESLLPDAASGGDGGGADLSGTDGASGIEAGGGTGTAPFGGLANALLPGTLLTLLRRGFFRYADGAMLAATDPGRLVTVFLRWGRHGYEPAGVFFGNGTNLSILESAPVAAAVLVAPLRYGIRLVRSHDRFDHSLTPVDTFALVFSVLLVAVYLPNLPVHLMVTVRYLHPIYPLLVYGAVRQRWLVDALDEHRDVGLWTYEAAVLLATPLAVGALYVSPRMSKGAVFQTVGLVALAAAGLLGVSGIGSLSDRFDSRASAVAVGLTTGVATVFLLLTAFVVMHFGMSALPFVDTVSGELRFAIVRNG